MDRKTRLGLILPELYHGGAEKQFRMLVDGLDKTAYDVTVFIEHSYGVVPSDAENSWIEERQHSARFISLKGLRTNNGHLLRLVSAARLCMNLLPFLMRRDLDVVLVYSALGMRTTPLFRLFRVPAIFSERNSAEYSRLDRLRKWVYFTAADRIVCNSTAASDRLIGYGYKPITIANAVELDGVSPRKGEWKTTDLTLVVPGRIATVKNQGLVVDALDLLEGLVSTVYLAGPLEDPSYHAELVRRSRIQKNKIRVESLGFVENMDALYSACDMVVLPSRAEGMPNVLLEALAREIPCIASDIPSNRDVLNNSELLFDVDDPTDLVSAVRFVATLSSTEAEELATHYRRDVSQRFSVDVMVAAYERLFRDRTRSRNG